MPKELGHICVVRDHPCRLGVPRHVSEKDIDAQRLHEVHCRLRPAAGIREDHKNGPLVQVYRSRVKWFADRRRLGLRKKCGARVREPQRGSQASGGPVEAFSTRVSAVLEARAFVPMRVQHRRRADDSS